MSRTCSTEAVALAPAERDSVPAGRLRGDASLRAEVESLLACDAGFPEGGAEEAS